jgi:hypothetical protein
VAAGLKSPCKSQVGAAGSLSVPVTRFPPLLLWHGPLAPFISTCCLPHTFIHCSILHSSSVGPQPPLGNDRDVTWVGSHWPQAIARAAREGPSLASCFTVTAGLKAVTPDDPWTCSLHAHVAG